MADQPSFIYYHSNINRLRPEVFPGFLRLWSNTIWRQPIAHAFYWHLGASDVRGGIGVDTGLILAQTALEGLAWSYCIMDRKLVSKSAFGERGGLNAANTSLDS